MAMNLRLIRGRKPKWQPTNSPGTRSLPEKSVPQPHAVLVLNGFHGSLPYQTLGGLPSQYACALVTSENWGGLKPPLEWRKPSVVASQIQLSNPRNCLRTTMKFYTNFFMLQATTEHQVLLLSCPWPARSPPRTESWRTLDLNHFQCSFTSYHYTFFPPRYLSTTHCRYHGFILMLYFTNTV